MFFISCETHVADYEFIKSLAVDPKLRLCNSECRIDLIHENENEDGENENENENKNENESGGRTSLKMPRRLSLMASHSANSLRGMPRHLKGRR